MKKKLIIGLILVMLLDGVLSVYSGSNNYGDRDWGHGAGE